MNRTPTFCDESLGALIEHAERSLMVAGAEAVRRRRPDADVFVMPFAGGVASYTGENSPLNKVAGIGFEGPVTDEQMEAVESAMASRNVPVQVELSTLANPEIGALLTKRGYVLYGFENVLGLDLASHPQTARSTHDIDIRDVDDAAFPRWLDAVVTGFLHRDEQGVPSPESFARETLEHSIGDFAATDGMRAYIAHRNGGPAGGASMRIHEHVAQLCGAATLPEHRRRGVQSALLRHRLAVATDAGCRIAVVTTLPGSKSQQNVQKFGFELLYARAILVRAHTS